jgi:hypothetical protein
VLSTLPSDPPVPLVATSAGLLVEPFAAGRPAEHAASEKIIINVNMKTVIFFLIVYLLYLRNNDIK